MQAYKFWLSLSQKLWYQSKIWKSHGYAPTPAVVNFRFLYWICQNNQTCTTAYVNHFEIGWNPLHSIHKHQYRLINSCLPTHIQKYTNHLCFAINWSKFGWNLRIYLLVLRVVVRICRKNRDSLLCISATHSRLNLENQLRMDVQYKIYRVGCIGVYLERCKIICGIWRSLVHESLEFFVFIIQFA